MKLFAIIKLEEKNGPDIESYINSEFVSLGLDHPLKDVSALAESMIGRAQGVFLWARLVLTELRDMAHGSTFLELERVLSGIPEDLKGVYGRIFRELEKKRDRAETKKIITMGPTSRKTPHSFRITLGTCYRLLNQICFSGVHP
jgi:hypothetical protein